MGQLNILFIGDIVGHVGLRKVVATLPSLIEKYKSDCVIVNGENIVDGKGLSEKEADELFANGAHCITTGNHVWENWKARTLLANNPRVLRPHNYPPENPGRGFTLVTLPDQRTVGVIQVQGRAYMQPIDDPFKSVDTAIAKLRMQATVLFVDFHADASAEKIAMGWHLDGRVSAICGTHTHTQTNDGTILPNGTAFISDVGMSGPYDSVIGMKKDIALKRMMLQTAHKYETAENDVRVCGAHIAVDEKTGIALEIEPFMIPAPRRTNTL
ncbi:MAG: TIGR00282 family metallophosphoesterase [Ignavibacteria bacterium]|nr:TIGR00282 family metallophosphoesterase [Ignavibacteria bacterium]